MQEASLPWRRAIIPNLSLPGENGVSILVTAGLPVSGDSCLPIAQVVEAPVHASRLIRAFHSLYIFAIHILSCRGITTNKCYGDLFVCGTSINTCAILIELNIHSPRDQ